MKKYKLVLQNLQFLEFSIEIKHFLKKLHSVQVG